MSQENVEVVRKLYAEVRFDRTDSESFGRAVNAFFTILDPDAEWQPDENDIDPHGLRGEAAIRDFFERHAEPWQEFRWEPRELHDVGDEVVALGDIYARGREAGVEVHAPYAHRFGFRGDRLVRGQEYLTQPERALVDAGLSE
jgi:ketosteroid isomerase-like protein